MPKGHRRPTTFLGQVHPAPTWTWSPLGAVGSERLRRWYKSIPPQFFSRDPHGTLHLALPPWSQKAILHYILQPAIPAWEKLNCTLIPGKYYHTISRTGNPPGKTFWARYRANQGGPAGPLGPTIPPPGYPSLA